MLKSVGPVTYIGHWSATLHEDDIFPLKNEKQHEAQTLSKKLKANTFFIL